MRTETLPKLACAYAGAVWGLFWIPLRRFDAAGITDLWAVALFYAAPMVVILPVVAWRWRQTLAGGASLQWLGLASASGLVLYSVAVLYTDVVRAMLLFYLTPVWSTLLARLVLSEAITAARWLAMGLGLAGLLIIFGIDTGMVLPRNVGDWLALLSGILWAVTAVMLRRETRSALDITAANFIWSLVCALAILGLADRAPMPDWAGALSRLPWWLPLLSIAIITGPVAAVWGAKSLSPGIVGLLFMTEISVGAATAALWANEPFGWREVLGIVLISGAGIAESLWDLISPRRASVA